MQVANHPYEIAGWGAGELWLDGMLVIAHDFPLPVRRDAGEAHPCDAAETPPRGAARPPVETLSRVVAQRSNGFVPVLVARVRAFLDGDQVDFDDVEIDLSWCTPYQAALAECLRAVPRGEVVSYGELAALAGRPGAARAAGAFCAANRHSLFIPCHRVVSAGGIGGYGSSGIALKRRLLLLEGVTL